MVMINLLPWRDYLRVYQAKKVKRMLLSAILFSLLTVCAMHYGLAWQLAHERDQMMRLEEKIQTLSLMAPALTQHFGEESQEKNRYGEHKKIKYLLMELTKKSAERLCFTDLIHQENAVTFAGHAENAIDFTRFLQNWQATKLFTQIHIEALSTQKTGQPVRFRFKAQYSSAKAVDDAL